MAVSSNFFSKRETTSSTFPPRQMGAALAPAAAMSASPASASASASAPVSASVVAESQTAAMARGGSQLTVGPNIKLKGVEITDCDTLVVEGLVEATMDSRVIHIAQQGEFHGAAEIDVAEIHGSFTGSLHVREKLVIHSTGKVSGKIRYGKLVVQEGGQLCGEIAVGMPERSTGKTPAAQTSNQRAASQTSATVSDAMAA